MKIRPNAAELFHAGGRTDRRTDRHDEAITLAFSQFFRTRLKIPQVEATPEVARKHVILKKKNSHWKGKPQPQNRKPESGPARPRAGLIHRTQQGAAVSQRCEWQ